MKEDSTGYGRSYNMHTHSTSSRRVSIIASYHQVKQKIIIQIVISFNVNIQVIDMSRLGCELETLMNRERERERERKKATLCA
jgi:hypothetical protein